MGQDCAHCSGCGSQEEPKVKDAVGSKCEVCGSNPCECEPKAGEEAKDEKKNKE